ncbi:transposable element Tcb1 transposase [Trichonephila clavipes]|nr:transposable element Tcb1 transposase [Trichonephila clavipes]
MKNAPAFRPGILPGRRVNGYKADSSRYFAGIFRPCKSVVMLDETKELSCGYVTVGCRRVRRTNVVDRIHLSVPLHNHRRLRRQWWDERRMWAAEWNEVVLTDESRICLQHHDGRIRVWSHVEERMLKSCVINHLTGPEPRIMVWGGIGYHSCTPLVCIAECMWFMVAQRLTQITSPSATPDQLWQRVVADWSAVPQEHI